MLGSLIWYKDKTQSKADLNQIDSSKPPRILSHPRDGYSVYDMMKFKLMMETETELLTQDEYERANRYWDPETEFGQRALAPPAGSVNAPIQVGS